MKRKIVFLCAIVIASVGLTTCETLSAVFKEPKLSLRSVDIASLSFKGATLLCKVNVENPNSFSIPFPDIDWNFFLNKNSFIKGKINSKQSIGSRRTTVVDVPVSFDYLDVFNTFSSLIGSNQTDYRVALAAKFAIPIIGDKVWNLERSGNLPLLKAPSISFSGITVKNLSLTNADFEFAWEVENNNIFAMKINEFVYDLKVNNSQWGSGKIANAPQISAGRKTRIPLTISVNNLAMVKDITDIITRGTDVRYACTGNMSFGADLPGLAPYTNPLNFTGTTKLRR